MTSFPVAICRISNNKFKRLYLKKERVFSDFLLHFLNVHEIENVLKKKKSIVTYLLTKFSNSKEMFT